MLSLKIKCSQILRYPFQGNTALTSWLTEHRTSKFCFVLFWPSNFALKKWECSGDKYHPQTGFVAVFIRNIYTQVCLLFYFYIFPGENNNETLSVFSSANLGGNKMSSQPYLVSSEMLRTSGLWKHAENSPNSIQQDYIKKMLIKRIRIKTVLIKSYPALLNEATIPQVRAKFTALKHGRIPSIPESTLLFFLGQYTLAVSHYQHTSHCAVLCGSRFWWKGSPSQSGFYPGAVSCWGKGARDYTQAHKCVYTSNKYLKQKICAHYLAHQ